MAGFGICAVAVDRIWWWRDGRDERHATGVESCVLGGLDDECAESNYPSPP
jgi:hypothetical protein